MKKITLSLALLVITYFNGFSQFLICDFTYNSNNTTPGSVGFSGPFYNYSPNDFYYLWSFGDLASANNIFPTHTYSQSGTYQVCLNIYSLSDSSLACNSCGLVTVNSGSSICNFNYYTDSTNTNTYFFNANVDTSNYQTCIWYIYGDSISNDNFSNSSIVYTFDNIGEYGVELTYLDSSGNVLCNSNQIVSVGGNSNPDCSMMIDQLSAQNFAFYQPVNSPPALSYIINYNDGNLDTNSNGQFVHTFNPGTYNICISATYLNGLTCNSCINLVVNDSIPACNFSYFPAPIGTLTYDFIADVDTSNSQTVTWIINGDTISPNTFANIYTSYSFPIAGVYSAVMNYNDSNGTLICSSTQFIDLTNINSCDFFVTQNSNQNYSFTSSFMGQPANDYYSITINGLALDTNYFGSFNYTLQPGYNTVCMTTTYLNNPSSCTSCQSITVLLNPIDSIACYISAVPNSANPSEYTFYLGAPNNLVWTITGSNGFIDTISQQNSSQLFYAFPFDGLFNISLTASDSFGNVICTNGYTIIILPTTNNNCNADFYAATSPLTGYFIDMSTGIDPQTTNYFWNFGDGSSSTERFPFHTYTSGGFYDVLLTIANGNCVDSTTQFIYIFDNDTTPAPIGCNAYFVVTQTSPYSVSVVNLSSGNNLNFSWTFISGTSYNTPFPTLQVPFGGSFRFCLTVNNSFCFSNYCDSISFDSLGVIQRTTEMLNINVVSPQEITGYSTTSVKESKENVSVTTYPNPFSDNFIIDNINGKFNSYSINTIDGREIINGKISKGLETIQTSEWSNGVYFLKLNSANGVSKTSKMIKK